jgi:transcriptional regulator CtsR
MVDIKRNTLAMEMGCAPSQINYVLETRFTLERGYMVRSKRGGGGFIRIIRIRLDRPHLDCLQLIRRIGDSISQDSATDYVEYLCEEEVISDREALIMKSVISRKTLAIPLPLRDSVRAKLLKAMILAVLTQPEEEEERNALPGMW